MSRRLDGNSVGWLVGYGIAAVVNLLAVWFEWHPLDTIAKALLMPLLAGFVWASRRRRIGTGDRFIVGALLFSWLGDLALEPSGDLFFYAGLGMFAVAQVAYLMAFNGRDGRRRPISRLIAVPFVLWWIVLVALLAPKMGVLVVAVAIYGALLLGMAATSWRISNLAGVGGLLFAVSDSLIALTSLGKLVHFAHSGVAIMATYIVGQLLLVLGWCRTQQSDEQAAVTT